MGVVVLGSTGWWVLDDQDRVLLSVRLDSGCDWRDRCGRLPVDRSVGRVGGSTRTGRSDERDLIGAWRNRPTKCPVRRSTGAVPSFPRVREGAALPTMPDHTRRPVTGGVDTHKDTHVAAVVDSTGRILGSEAFPATKAGYARLWGWLCRWGRVERVGVEGTGTYGAGLARYLAGRGVAVVEVNRPNRQVRRLRGKSDTVDAEAAARAALNGEASALPKSSDGAVEAIRSLRVARRSALKARTQAANQIQDLLVTAPDELRERFSGATSAEIVAVAARFRFAAEMAPAAGTKLALRSLARRYEALSAEIVDLDTVLAELVTEAAPNGLLECFGVGIDVAGALLVAAGDNPDRVSDEAAFAALCGASPVDASSGKQRRHRLNRGGDRQANGALWRIVMVRMSLDPRTRAYVARRTAEGKTKKEIIRCLKRYVAREVFKILTKTARTNPTAEYAQAA